VELDVLAPLRAEPALCAEPEALGAEPEAL
jgi:hypothetical protein